MGNWQCRSRSQKDDEVAQLCVALLTCAVLLILFYAVRQIATKCGPKRNTGKGKVMWRLKRYDAKAQPQVSVT